MAQFQNRKRKERIMSRRILLATIVVIVAVFAVSGAAMAGKRFFGVATGGVGGVYYPLGGACAQCLTNKIPDMIVTAQSGNASVANTNLVARGEVESGLAQNNVALAAYTGDKTSWKTPQVKKLRGIASMYPETVHLVALKKSGIKSIHDFKGKRIIVGDKGSGTEFDSRRILSTMGLSYDDIQPVFVYYATAVQRMKDEQADAMFWTSGVPSASMIEIATTKDVEFFPFPDDIAMKLNEKYPYYAQVTMPANSYMKQPNPVKTIAMMAIWVTISDVNEKDIYDVTYNLWEDTPLIYRKKQEKISCAEVLGKVHKQGENVKLENALLGMTVPLHVGAYKYYKEKGISVPENLIPPEVK
jgi:TRAP transporter TAXI family solute receptor